jgi:hypothetical protein
LNRQRREPDRVCTDSPDLQLDELAGDAQAGLGGLTAE